MTDRQPCEPTCSQPCATPCADHPATLSEVLARFEREAVRGVCDTGRYPCRYYSWGAGPPLLLLHGLEDSSQAFVLLAARLARSFRCVAYDLPSGDSDGASLGPYTHADLVADLHALLDHLGLRQTYLFGTSLGSTVALAALHATPGRFPRAILHAPMAYRPLSPWERVVARFRSHYPWSMAALPRWRRTMNRLHHGPFAGRPPERWDYFLDYRGRLPARAAGRQARLLHGIDLRPLLGEVRQPVLLVCGDVDPVVPMSATDA